MPKIYIVIFSLCALMFSGCSHNAQPTGKPLPDLRFDHLNPYRIHGGGVRIEQSYRATPESQVLAGEFPMAPDALIQRYAVKRFDSKAMPHRLVFDIKDASLGKITDSEDLLGFFTGSASEHYVLNILIAMTPIRRDGHRSAPFTIKLDKRLEIPHNASLAEREFRKFEFLEKAISDIDKTVTQMVQRRMTAQYF